MCSKFRPSLSHYCRTSSDGSAQTNFGRTPSLVQFPSLPPATKLGQGNIFSSACQEFCSHRGGGPPHCMLGYIPQEQTCPMSRHPSRTRGRPSRSRHPLGPDPPRSRHPSPRIRHPPESDTPWTRGRHLPPGPEADPLPHSQGTSWEIRATSGRYTSYWNAILFRYSF